MPPPKRLIHDDRIRSATPRDTWNSSISGRSRCRDMAQTRRMGMQNDWTELREAPRFSPCYGSCQNYRIGFGARFAFLFATLVASNWGIRIARWLREWARRNSSLEEPPSNPNAGDLKCCSLSLVTSYLEVCGQLFAFDRPTCYPCPALPSSGSHYALYEHGRGKRAHPIYQRVLAQGRSRARAAYQSCLF
jgi:hypothetical protein